jgi:hypothetical protein
MREFKLLTTGVRVNGGREARRDGSGMRGEGGIRRGVNMNFGVECMRTGMDTCMYSRMYERPWPVIPRSA